MKQIYKYEFPASSPNLKIDIPGAAKFLSLQMQKDDLCLCFQ